MGRALTPPVTPDVVLGNGALRIAATGSASGAAAEALAHLDLEAGLFDPVRGSRTVDLGPLRSGRYIYRGGPQAGCPCRLTGIGVLPNTKRVPNSGHLQLGLNALTFLDQHGAPNNAQAELVPEAWRPSLTGVRVTAGSSVRFDIPMKAVAANVGPYRNTEAASLVGPPPVLPAVGGSQAQFQGETLAEQGLDGNTITVQRAVTASSLPRIGPAGVLVDLGRLEAIQVAPTFLQASKQVWLGSHAPADAISRLRAAGLPDRRCPTLIASHQPGGPQRSSPGLRLHAAGDARRLARRSGRHLQRAWPPAAVNAPLR